MNDQVGSLLARGRLVLTLAACLSIPAGIGVWYGSTLFAPEWVAVLAGVVSSALIVILISRSALKRAYLDLRHVAEALSHVASQPTQDLPPKPASDLSKQLVTQIYELAASSKGLTTAIEQNRSQLATVLDLLPVGVFVFNNEQRVTMANDTAERMLAVKPGELDGLLANQALDWLFQTDENYEVWLDQVRGKTVHADKFWERVSLVSKDNQRLIGDVAVHYEKSQARDVETVVVYVERTAEYTADEAQLDFVSVAAHELRGPITVIRGYLDVFNQELTKVLNVEQRSLLQKMAVSAEMLSLYVNNILNVARLDQQNMQLHIRETDWREVLKETYADLFLRAQAHGRLLKLELPASLPSVAVDRVSITEVINNLVDNAIKYSKEGGEIIIRSEEHEGLISTTVQDFGIGIPEGILGNLFKKFYRSHRTRRGVSGTGLGLYLSKAIMDAHGGNIWVRSQVGMGSTFGFDLPTYASIADTLKKGDNDAVSIKHSSRGWIKNHAMYRQSAASNDKPPVTSQQK